MDIFNKITVKTKLVIICILVASLSLIYAIFENHSINKIIELEDIKSLNWKVEAEILTLRRHEKDFLNRHEFKYVDKFEKTMEHLIHDLEELDQYYSDVFNDNHSSGYLEIRDKLKHYDETFHKIGQEYKTLYQDGGLLLDIKTLRHEVEAELMKNIKLLREAVEAELLKGKDIQQEHYFLVMIESDYEFLIDHTQKNLDAFIEAKADFMESIQDSKNPALLTKTEEYVKAYSIYIDIISRIGFKYNEGMLLELRKDVHAAEKFIINKIEEIDIIIRNEISSVKSELHYFSIFITGISLTSIIFVAYLISGRTRLLMNKMDNVANGDRDLTTRLTLKGNDEFTTIATHFNTFVKGLQESFKEIKDISLTIDTSTNNSLSNIEKTEENYQSTLSEITHMGSAIHEMVTANKEISNALMQADFSAENLKGVNDEAHKIFVESNEKVANLYLQLIEGQKHIDELHHKSENIQSVTQSIQNIASQINLLSLNAAIEAARAGEHGKGFAVVADEVRQLSIQTDQATHNIDSTIQSLKKEIHEVIDLMKSASNVAESTSEHSEEATQKFGTVYDHTMEVKDRMTQISTASEQQSYANKEINVNLQSITGFSNNIANDISSCREEAKNINDKVSKLTHIVDQFKI
tara:strand:- start:10016 stop:11929 length:1914 start_codon:yes stop_codon:yes gene_type:complete